MKKIFLLLLMLFVIVRMYSQDNSGEYLHIAEKIGNDIAANFKTVEGDIQKLAGSDTIVILFLPVYNADGDLTKLSYEITDRLANIVQQKIKSLYSHFDQITVIFSKNAFPQCDFYLRANYLLTPSAFLLENIYLQKPDLSAQIALTNSSCILSSDLSADDATIIKPEIFYINSHELNLQSETFFIKNSLTAGLLKYDYGVTTEKNKADLLIDINATVSQANKIYGIYFCNAEVTVTMTNKKTHLAVFQKTYTDIRGGSPKSYQEAADNALKSVAEKVLNDVLTFLAFRN